MNKFDLMNKVYTSDLTSTQKNLLCYLITKSNNKWESWPSVARLAQVAGVKYEKNFVLSKYLDEEFVTVRRTGGKRNHYILNPPALAGLTEGVVVFNETHARKNPPATEGGNPPAPAENPPAVEGVYPPAGEGLNPPAVEGTYSTEETTRETTEETTEEQEAAASLNFEENDDPDDSLNKETDRDDLSASSKYKHPPAPAGVSEEEWNSLAEAEGFGSRYRDYLSFGLDGFTAFYRAKDNYERKKR